MNTLKAIEQSAAAAAKADTLRAVAELMRREGLSLNAACDRLRLSPATISRWRKAKEAGGEQALRPRQQQSGRKPRYTLDKEQARLLRQLTLKTGSIPLAIELFAQTELCPDEMRESILETCRKNGRHPASLTRAAYVTPEEEMLLRGEKNYQLHSHTVPRSMTEITADGQTRAIAPGDWWEMDDMSVNEPFWFTAPDGTEHLGRQILFARDLASGYFIGFDIVARPRDAYRGEDILRSCGRLIRAHGLPRRGLRLERGAWEGLLVEGEKIIGEDEALQRLGGLRALGIEVRHTFQSKGKGGIEGAFNQIQKYFALCGLTIGRHRGEFEQAKQLTTRVRSGSLPASQSGFRHIDDLAARLEAALHSYHAHHQHGELIKGAPADLWAEAIRNAPLAPPDPAHLWAILPVRRKVSTHAGHVLSTVEGYGRLAFRLPPTLATLGSGHSVVAIFDPANPHWGCWLFNNERPDSPRNRARHAPGAHLGHCEHQPAAPQFNAHLGFSATPEGKAKKEYNNAVRTHFRALAPHGQTLARAAHLSDGKGRDMFLEDGLADPQPAALSSADPRPHALPAPGRSGQPRRTARTAPPAALPAPAPRRGLLSLIDQD